MNKPKNIIAPNIRFLLAALSDAQCDLIKYIAKLYAFSEAFSVNDACVNAEMVTLPQCQKLVSSLSQCVSNTLTNNLSVELFTKTTTTLAECGEIVDSWLKLCTDNVGDRQYRSLQFLANDAKTALVKSVLALQVLSEHFTETINADALAALSMLHQQRGQFYA